MKKLIRYLHDIWLVLTHPECWIRVEPYSKSWDHQLNQLMEEYQFERVDPFTARIGSFSIWIMNHPYASFSPINLGHDVVPKRSTVIRAWRKMEEDTIGEPIKGQAK